MAAIVDIVCAVMALYVSMPADLVQSYPYFFVISIGEVARVDLRGFTLDGSPKKDFGQAQNRAARDGITFGIIFKEELAPVPSGTGVDF